jgi:hypothetical protein
MAPWIASQIKLTDPILCPINSSLGPHVLAILILLKPEGRVARIDHRGLHSSIHRSKRCATTEQPLILARNVIRLTIC